jgi:hypothetical protein
VNQLVSIGPPTLPSLVAAADEQPPPQPAHASGVWPVMTEAKAGGGDNVHDSVVCLVRL